MRIKRFLVMLLLAVTGVTSGCATNKSNIHGFNLISVDQERDLGNKFAAEVEKQQQVLNDPEVEGYVAGIGKRLLTGAKEVDFDYTFKVVKDDSINAFAIPGGHVYIQTGLLKAAQSEDELAGVMAHEINHVVARHGTRQLTQQYGYALILQLLLGQNPNLLSQLAASLFGKAGFLAYSRGMESQADYLGVETMYKAGYDPRGMLTFFEKLQGIQKEKPNSLTRFLSSHPLTADRIRDVKEEIAGLAPKNYSPGNDAEFMRIKKKVQ